MLNDEQVMSQVAQGDIKQLAVLFNRYHVKLYNFFYKMNYNQALSEDLTQNVFERMIKYKTSFDNQSAFVPWMFRIARNVNADHFRNKKLKIDSNVEVAKVEMAETYETTNDQQKYLLKQAMNKISPDYKEVLILTRYNGLQYKEVAETLSCSESNVKVRVHRAVKALRKEYLKLQTSNR